MLGGSIGLESRFQKGSKFLLSIPLIESEENEEEIQITSNLIDIIDTVEEVVVDMVVKRKTHSGGRP